MYLVLAWNSKPFPMPSMKEEVNYRRAVRKVHAKHTHESMVDESVRPSIASISFFFWLLEPAELPACLPACLPASPGVNGLLQPAHHPCSCRLCSVHPQRAAHIEAAEVRRHHLQPVPWCQRG